MTGLRLGLSALILSAALATPAAAQSNTTLGVGSGAVAGALVGGPIGAVAGAVIGGVVGSSTERGGRLHRRRVAVRRAAHRRVEAAPPPATRTAWRDPR